MVERETVNKHLMMEGGMSEEKFLVSEAWTVMLIFFDKVWEKIEAQFSHDYVSEHVFLAMLQLDFECYLEWVQCCKKGMGLSDEDKTRLSRIEVQKLSREFVLYFQTILGFPLPVLLKYFDGALEVSALWDDAFTAVQDGIRWRREEKSPDLDKYLRRKRALFLTRNIESSLSSSGKVR